MEHIRVGKDNSEKNMNNCAVKPKSRITSLDFLRIISMLMIVAFHYQIHIAGDMAMFEPFSYKQLVLILMGSWGVYGSNCFWAISAYFLTEKRKSSLDHLLRIMIKEILIGLVLYCLLVGVGGIDFKTTDIVKIIFAPFTYQYWFVTIWIIIMLIFPLLNKAIEEMGRRQYFCVLCLLFYFFFVYASINGFEIAGRLGCAIWIYLCVGYVRRFLNNEIKHAKLLLMICISVNLIYEISKEITQNRDYIYLFENGASTTAAIGSICLLYIFISFKDISWNTNLSRFLKWGGEHSFGAFLICFPAVVPRKIVYDELLKGEYFWRKKSLIFLLVYVATTILVCLSGFVLDWIYDASIGKCISKVINKSILSDKESV